MLVVDIYLTVELAAEEIEIHSDIPGACPLPAEGRVTVAGHRASKFTGHDIRRRTYVHERLECSGLVLVAVISERRPQGQLVDPGDIFHKGLVGNLPACSHRPER